MRIGMVTGEYPPMQGGVGDFTHQLVVALRAQGHEVSVFMQDSWGWQMYGRLRQWVADNQIEVADIQFQTAAFGMHPAIHFVPRVLPVPVVTTFHDLRVPYLFPKAGPVRDWIVRRLAADSAGVIATNHEDEARLRDGWAIPNVSRIPIGSNIAVAPPANFERSKWRQQAGVGADEGLISYFGFWNASKGGLELVEAVGRLRAEGLPLRLVLIGGQLGASDPTNKAYAQAMRARITTLGLEDAIIETGFVSEEDVSAWFLASDLSALPYRDGVSLRRGTLMAALVHGRAIVTTHPQISLPELSNALHTVERENPAALAAGIRRVWEDPTLRATLETQAQVAARQFEWRHIAEQTAEALA